MKIKTISKIIDKSSKSSKNSKTKKTKKTKNSILKKLILSFVLIIILSLGIISILTGVITTINTQDQFIGSTTEVLEQNKNYIEYIIKTVNNYSVQIVNDSTFSTLINKKDEDSFDKVITYQRLQDYMNNFQISNDTINSMYVLNSNGLSFGTHDFDAATAKSDTIQKFKPYNDAMTLNGNSFWMSPHKDEFLNNKEFKVISFVRSINRDSNSGGQVLFINIDSKLINDTLANTKIGNSGYIFIVDKDGNIISHKDPKMLGTNANNDESIKQLKSDKGGTFIYTDSKTKQKMFGVYTVSKTNQWRYVAVVPYNELTLAAKKTTALIMIISIICLILSLLVAVKISFSISNPLGKVVGALKEVEDGNLNLQVTYKSKDEFGTLRDSFNEMIGMLKKIVGEVKNSSDNINTSAKFMDDSVKDIYIMSSNISETITQISQGATAQACDAATCVEISEDFGVKFKDLIENTNEVHNITSKTKEKSDEGMKSINSLNDSTIESMKKIQDVAGVIKELSQNTQEVTQILTSIKQISEQTNLLSLNAAIEAARAGEAGKGFAVVADEVRKLADQTKMSAQDISKIVSLIGNRTEESIKVVGLVIEDSKVQTEYVKSTMDIFNEIKNSIDVVEEKVKRLDQVLKETDVGKEELLNSIRNIAAVSEESAASTEEINATIEGENDNIKKINDVVESVISSINNLNQSVNRFKI